MCSLQCLFFLFAQDKEYRNGMLQLYLMWLEFYYKIAHFFFCCMVQFPINPYGKAKKMAEDIILDFHRNSNMAVMILRYFSS